MKKAKLMLTAIAVLAVVGVGLAFKAAKFNTKTYYKLDLAGTSCNVPFQATTIGATTSIFASTIPTLKVDCPRVFLTTVEH